MAIAFDDMHLVLSSNMIFCQLEKNVMHSVTAAMDFLAYLGNIKSLDTCESFITYEVMQAHLKLASQSPPP